MTSGGNFFEQKSFDETMIASADLSGSQYYLMVGDTTAAGQKAALPTVRGQRVCGVLQNAPTSTHAASICRLGTCPVFFGGTVASGDPLTTSSAGKAIKATLATDYVFGVAREDGLTGEIHPCDLTMEGVLGGGAGVTGGSRRLIAIPINLASITTNQDVVTSMLPTMAGTITSVFFSVNAPATTGSKLTTLTVFIGATAVTGGVVALTSANCTPMGAQVAGSTVTAANTLASTDAISVKSTSTTAFVEGSGTLYIAVS